MNVSMEWVEAIKCIKKGGYAWRESQPKTIYHNLEGIVVITSDSARHSCEPMKVLDEDVSATDWRYSIFNPLNPNQDANNNDWVTG